MYETVKKNNVNSKSIVMPNQSFITDKIDRYLNHEMSTEELSQFEREIKANPNLKNEIKQQKDIISYIEQKGNKDLKSFLSDIEYKQTKPSDDVVKKQSKIITLRKIVTGIAAGLAILLASIWTFRNTQIQQPSELFSEFYSPYPNDLVKIERSNENNSFLQKAMIKYSQKEYQAAINDIDQYIFNEESEHLDNELLFFKAISYVSLNNLPEARQSLETLNSIENFEYSDKVSWYLSLVYLKTGDIVTAKKSLEQLINSGQSYKMEEAKIILRQLN